MKVRDEIEKYADEKDKPALRWLFERNHWESQWNYVAVCEHVNPAKVFMGGHRVWKPSPSGQALYDADLNRRRLVIVQEFLRNATFDDSYYGQTLSDNAAILATEFNPGDFEREQNQ